MKITRYSLSVLILLVIVEVLLQGCRVPARVAGALSYKQFLARFHIGLIRIIKVNDEFVALEINPRQI